jgi:hypothetical protein
MSDYIAKHKISKRATQALQDGGILRKTSGTRHAKWYWASPVIPNIKMADELYGRCIKLNNDYQIKHRAEMAIENKPQFTEVLEEAMVEKVKEDTRALEAITWGLRPEERKQNVQYHHVASTPSKPVKEQVAPVVEREKLFSVLWGVIKVKW